QAQAPQEVRVGQSYDYNLTIENITDNVMLEDVRIRHEDTGNFSVERAETGSSQQGQSGQQQQGQQQQGQQQGQQQEQGQQQQGQEQQGQQQQSQQQQQPDESDRSTVTIGELRPGQSQTVR